MASFLILLLIPLLALALNIPGPKASLEDMMKTFSEIEHIHSINLNSSNFHSALSINSNPWFIFFSEPRSMQSVIKNPVWMIFSSHVNEKNIAINTGVVNLAKENELRRKFRVFTVPAFVYLEDGYAYNFTGSVEPDDLENVLSDKLYLQYDRMRLDVNANETSKLLAFKKEFVKNPAGFVLGVFVASLAGLSSFSFLVCKGKKEDKGGVKRSGSKKRE